MDDKTVSEVMREMGRKGGMIGGKARVPKGTSMLTKRQRKALGRKAAAARWKGKTNG